jgi:branched-chain amino acid transport system permease protein
MVYMKHLKSQNRFLRLINNKIILILLAISGLLSFPFLLGSYTLHIVIVTMYYCVVTSCWNLLAGYTGIFNLAQNAFAGIAAYSFTLLIVSFGLPFGIVFVLAPLISTSFALFISQLTLKMRAIYLAVATWAFTASLKLFIAASHEWTGGWMGLGVPRIFNQDIYFYYLFLFLTIIFLGIIRWITKSKIGLFAQAVRDDEVAAAVMGIDVFKVRRIMFVISGFFTGVMGVVLASFIGIIDPGLFEFKEMGTIILMTVLGGYGNFLGPIYGSSFLEILSEALRPLGQLRFIIFGIIGIIVMLIFRKGISGIINSIIRKLKNLNIKGFK